jgi:hypothetical protein
LFVVGFGNLEGVSRIVSKDNIRGDKAKVDLIFQTFSALHKSVAYKFLLVVNGNHLAKIK